MRELRRIRGGAEKKETIFVGKLTLLGTAADMKSMWGGGGFGVSFFAPKGLKVKKKKIGDASLQSEGLNARGNTQKRSGGHRD